MTRHKHSAYRALPLVYSCSGCSSAAQLANHVAVRLDREALAEMSCIAGVGGDVHSLVQTAKADRPIIAIDGCHLQCAKNCLKKHGVAPTLHYTLSDLGVRKRYHAEFEPSDAEHVLYRIRGDLRARTREAAAGEPTGALPLAPTRRIDEEVVR